MSGLEIIHCDPISISKRKYVPRIPNSRWDAVRHDVSTLHRRGCKHKAILAYLRSERGLKPTLSQLGSKMSEWKLFTYRTMARCSIPPCPSSTLFRVTTDITDQDDMMTRGRSGDVISQISIPRLQCSLPLYSSDDDGNLIPSWSAFLLRAAQGDSLAMKTICILAKSQRFKRTQSDYLLYQQVIEAVRSEMGSSETLSLQMSIMIFYAILALAIQAGFMNGRQRSLKQQEERHMVNNEPAIHLNAASHMLDRINMQTPNHLGSKDTLKQLVDFFNVANYLLALSRCSQSEVAAWPLLMYHLIVQ